jgi:hypothetical protein
MKEKFDGKLNVKIFTLDSKEAKPYAQNFKGSTNVFLNNEWVPLRIAIDKSKMEDFLSQNL